ncbi:phosphoglycolate phosphatase [Paenibacillus phyllosphaerae]|uniref:Phosphoglycolate phosphatase n=1 Tax=Paenibacillus phyllosphaerae TaxID=274593 RepID=A0A7W5FPG5_9BACL|nr:HAD family hydrolase [Paenibacillus phyllosphaerae]MBB3112243.1 phosphoglycolate phosphatase [Paenibacillus phyllosphaerae]
MADRSLTGLIFDMDNTLLRSTIDFPAMKGAVAAYLTERGHIEADFGWTAHTTSTLLAHAEAFGGLSAAGYEEAMKIAAVHERRGMVDAGLEPFAEELLELLHGQATLVLITNNAYEAAEEALERTGIGRYFDLVMGREQQGALKPSPAGFLKVKAHYPAISDERWLSIGDSWIDGQASAEAGIPFVCYGGALQAMEERGVRPVAQMQRLDELPVLLTKLGLTI